MLASSLQASNQFAPKLAVTDILQSECVEWKTATEGWFQIEGARFRFQRVWIQVASVDLHPDADTWRPLQICKAGLLSLSRFIAPSMVEAVLAGLSQNAWKHAHQRHDHAHYSYTY